MASYHGVPSIGSGSSSSSNFQFMSSPFGDTTYTKVFVGGLAWETKSDTMRRYFEQFGEILEAVVISDKNTCRSKGYGFVTFREPDAARRACFDSAPIIDGRRTNCNLASLGRPRSSLPYGRLRSAGPPYISTAQAPAVPIVGGYGFQQPVPYNYPHQAVMYHPSYGYIPYPPEHCYPSQGGYGPYVGHQQYLQLYGVPRTVGAPMYPYGQLGQQHPVPGAQGYALAPHHLLPFSVVAPAPPSSVPPNMHPSYTGMASPLPAQPFVIHAHSQFIPRSGSDQSSV